MKHLHFFISTLVICFLSFATPSILTAQGNMMDFDGANDYIQLPGTWGGLSLTEMTIEVWVNIKAPNGQIQAILSSNQVNQFVHFQVNQNNELGIFAYTNSGGVSLPSSPITLSKNQWNHVAVVLKSGDSNIYVNGEKVGNTNTAIFNNINPSSIVTIGRGFSNSRYLNGQLDEVRIWDDARTIDEIRANRHLKLTGSESNLLAYYSFDNATTCSGISGEIEDESSNSADATCINMQNGSIMPTDVSIGSGQLDSVSNTLGGNLSLNNLDFEFEDDFDFTQDIYVSHIQNGPNSLIGVIGDTTLGNSYYVVNLYENSGPPGTFDLDLNFNGLD